MSVINFTAKLDLFASQNDSSDGGVDVDIVPMVGSVVFTPLFDTEGAVMAADYLPNAAGFKLLPISGWVDSDGSLKDNPGGNVGVRLLANDPVFELDSLTYRVDFNLHTPAGRPVSVDSGYFFAPVEDVVVNLAEVLQTVASYGSPRIISGSFADGAVSFVNADYSVVSPIEIPNGTLVFVDNGDSTWTLGS